MKLYSPVIITPRLMAGLRTEGLTVSIERSDRPMRDGRVRFFYALDFDDGLEYERDDLSSPGFRPETQNGLCALLSFMSAAVERARYKTYEGSDDEPIFSEEVDQRLSEFGDAIEMWQYEFEMAEENDQRLIEE